MAHDTSVTIRLPAALLSEADELLPQLQVDPRYRTMPRLSRAAVLRLALDMGLQTLRVHLATAPILEVDGLLELERRPNG